MFVDFHVNKLKFFVDACVYIFFTISSCVINNTFGQHCYTFEAIFGMLMYPTLSFVYFFFSSRVSLSRNLFDRKGWGGINFVKERSNLEMVQFSSTN